MIDVRPNLPQLLVLQTEVPDHPRSEVLGEHVADRDQLQQRAPTLRLCQVERQALLVSILLVEVDRPVPVLARRVIVVKARRPVQFDPRTRLDSG